MLLASDSMKTWRMCKEDVTFAGFEQLQINVKIWGSISVYGCDRWISTEDTTRKSRTRC